MQEPLPTDKTDVRPERAAIPAEGQSPGDRPWRKDHFINIRLSIPLVFASFYLTIVAGTERRNPERLKRERGKHPLATLGNLLCFGYAGLALALALGALIIAAVVLLLRQMFDVELILN